MDAQVVAASMEVAYKDLTTKLADSTRSYGSLGWYFMDKFIQLQFVIPNLSAEQQKSFLGELFKQKTGDGESPSEKKQLDVIEKEVEEELEQPAVQTEQLIQSARKIAVLRTDRPKQWLRLTQKLVETGADPDDKKHNRDRAVEAVGNNAGSFVRIAVPGLFAPENRDKFAKEIEEVTEVALRMAPDSIMAALKGMKIRKDRSDVFKSGNYPKLLVIGRKDPALDLDTVMPQARFPGVETVTFDDGHMSHIENRLELTQHLMRFLDSISN